MKLLLCFFLLYCTLGIAQTTVPAGNVSGTWTAASSPYQVQGLIVVQDGQTLTIEPGVTVEFASNARLRVKGNIIATGTQTNQILMTAQNIASGWQSIFLDSVNVASDSSIFKYCTIEYGKGTGLFRILNFSKVRIENCVLQNGEAFGGACAFLSNTDAIFKNNLIQNNDAQNNGGAFFIGGTGTCVFTGNTIINNNADNFGGAIVMYDPATPEFIGNTISNNQALTGGAIYSGNFCEFTLDGNTFDNNTSTFDGAVIWGGNLFPTVTNNTFTNNSAGGQAGVGFFQSFSNATFSGNYYSANSSNGGSGGGVFFITSNSDLRFINDTFHANTSSQNGKAIRVEDYSTLTLENCHITNNYGGIAVLASGNATIHSFNSVFANNSGGGGTAVTLSNNSTGYFTNSNFVHNESTGSVGCVMAIAGSDATYTNCIFKGNTSAGPFNTALIEFNGWNPSSSSFIHCNIEGGLSSIDTDGGPDPPFTNNIDLDPLFIAPTVGAGETYNGLNANWSIGSNSPCYNAGTPDTTGLSLPTTDLAGNNRIIQDTVDIGAFELVESAEVLAQTTDTSVCEGDSIVLSVATSGIPSIAYQWQFNGSDITGANSDTLVVTGIIPNVGSYRCIVSNSFGLDTSDLIAVTLNTPPVLSSLGSDTAFCAGTSLTLTGDVGNYIYDWNNGASTDDSIVVTAIGGYYYSVADTNGCSAMSDTINVSNYALPNVSLQGDTACIGDSIILHSNENFVTYDWNNGLSVSESLSVFTSGPYILEVTDTNNCVASDTADVFFNALPIIDIGMDQAVCPGDSTLLFAPTNMVSYSWNSGLSSADSIYANSPGDWYVTVIDTNGCANADTMTLSNLPTSSGVDIVSACESFTWIDGITYTSSNSSAQWTLTNSVGCDSLVTLDLTINTATTGTDIVAACNSYTWIDGNNYTSSNNTAQWTITNSQGCDSIVTLDLTINTSSSGTDVITSCDSYTWINGATYTTSNNSAQVVLTNSVGCDSLVTLDLTILNSTTGTDVITACDSYTWIDGNTYTSSNNSAQWMLTNAQGCDSVVTLDLTINAATANVTSNDPELIADPGATSYQWLDCLNGYAIIQGATNNSIIPTSNGEYAVVIEVNGCLDTSTCFVINNVGISSIESQNWKLYPNPTNGKVTLKFHDTPLNAMVEITNPLGQIISKQEINASEVDLILGKESGIYFVRVISENREEVVPVVKL